MDYLDRYMEIIPDYGGFIKALHDPLPVTVRVNTLKTSAKRLHRRLDRQGIEYEQFEWYEDGLRLRGVRPGLLVEHVMGLVHPQEEVSMIPALVLDPRPGEEVLDMCAAPGSKTTQIAQLMENRGTLVANEPSGGRIVPLRANCDRVGALNVVVTKYDGRAFPRHQFDKVLVDAPCSGEGMARKDLSVIKRCNLKRSLGLQHLQRDLLSRALRLTRPGGTVIYSTCTYAPEENEAVVDWVLGRQEDVSLGEVSSKRLESFSSLERSPGLEEWNTESYRHDMRHCARYYPHQNDTGGFFVAKLVKGP